MKLFFQMYHTAKKLGNFTGQDMFLPVFASSDVEVYPFQMAAVDFAVYSPYRKGIILCDESGLGKSYEAMFLIVQKWYERKKVLLVVPNDTLLNQWIDMIENHYTVPYTVIADREQWIENESDFEQEGIVVTTYDFLEEYSDYAKLIPWDLTVFEEATALCSVYQEENKQAKQLKEIAEHSFKLLLTGTPIEKNIMDLYGLIYFIDENILMEEQAFLKRYLRQPENYQELAQSVSRYCFRTLRSQAKQYAKITNRLFITKEYTLSKQEQELYNRIYMYCNQPEKLAFPEINPYDLTLKLLDLQGSSTAAILQTINGIIKRLKEIPNAQEELEAFEEMKQIAVNISIDSKTKELLTALQKGFQILEKAGARKKAVIFTSNSATQKYLYQCLKEQYKTVLFHHSADYRVIKQFKEEAELLISTDYGARGFHLAESAFVIHYDLLYNSLKMEQRIDRCHRLGQENDIISLAFIDKNNFADVRKLELINKRMLVADGVFGISDKVVGNFTENMQKAFQELAKEMRTKKQIEKDYQATLEYYEEENRKLVAKAEASLYTTFTKKIADRVKITPQYAKEKSKEINQKLWEVVKWYFEERNKTETDCYYIIDEKEQTITASNYEELPILFYYWTGSKNKKYRSLKKYGMSNNFKPHTGRITLTSVIGRGILHEIACADKGSLILNAEIEPCTIGFYTVSIYKKKAFKELVREYYTFAGETKTGKLLTEEECKKIFTMPLLDSTEEGDRKPHWLRTSSKRNKLDRLIDTQLFLEKQKHELDNAQAEEVDRIKLLAKRKKTELDHTIRRIKIQMEKMEREKTAFQNDRFKILAINKKLNKMQQEWKQKKEQQFFEEMQIDMEAENEIDEFFKKEKLFAEVVREFIIDVKGTNESE